jgi:hypothetical protein
MDTNKTDTSKFISGLMQLSALLDSYDDKEVRHLIAAYFAGKGVTVIYQDSGALASAMMLAIRE